LYKLDVRQTCPRPRGKYESISRGLRRIGGIAIELSDAASRQHHGAGSDDLLLTRRLPGHNADHSIRVDHEIVNAGGFDDLNPVSRPSRGP
jgi:hypothetical protein